jgi:hypothetical protein
MEATNHEWETNMLIDVIILAALLYVLAEVASRLIAIDRREEQEANESNAARRNEQIVQKWTHR